jgi:hypothetical protein
MTQNDDQHPTDQSGQERQDPLVERLRPDPGRPAIRVLRFDGFAGRSDRPGYRRLYLSLSLDRYLEVRAEDVVAEEQIAAADPPMQGLDSTRWHVRRDASVEYVRSVTPRPLDEFDLDVRLGSQAQTLPDGGGTQITICRGHTCVDIYTCDDSDTCNTCQTRCHQQTCQTCQTCFTNCDQNTCQNTCNTCQTNCNQNTCQNTCQTCLTNCQQDTCNTCNTNCQQATCDTCHTRCEQWTCPTSHTCPDVCFTNNPHIPACRV